MPTKGPLRYFQETYDMELRKSPNDYSPLETVILNSLTIRMFVYKVCKNILLIKEEKPHE